MERLSLGMYCAAGCGGCDISLLDLHEHLIDLVTATDIVFWPAAMDVKYADVEAMPDESIGVCLVNGAIRSQENVDVVRLLRRKSRVLVAYGACASSGGVPGLGDLQGTDALLERVFSTESTDEGAEAPSPESIFPGGEPVRLPAITDSVAPLSDVVRVDLVIPGCAPVAEQVWAMCEAIVAAAQPDECVLHAGTRSVCDECALEKRGTRVSAFVRPHEIEPEPGRCLMEQGLVCMGPVTRSGCGGRCMRVSMPCRGCYGPTEGTRDVGAGMVSMLGTIVEGDDEDAIREAMTHVADPAGTFYGFTLPASILGRARLGRSR